MPEPRKPIVSELVHYYPSSARHGRPVTEPRAAIVVHVENERQVNITYFNPMGDYGYAQGVRFHQPGDAMIPGDRVEFIGTKRPPANLAEAAQGSDAFDPRAPGEKRKRA